MLTFTSVKLFEITAPLIGVGGRKERLRAKQEDENKKTKTRTIKALGTILSMLYNRTHNLKKGHALVYPKKAKKTIN
jgi:hypothetical protein